MSWTSVIGSIAIVALLVGVNAFFVAGEFAVVRVRRTRLEELARDNVEAARATILLVERLSESLVTTQIGVTIASLGVGWLGEAAFADLLVLCFPSMFAETAGLHVLASAMAFVVTMLLHVVLGEIIPRNIAIERAESVSLRLARPLLILGRILRPLVWAFNGLSDLCTRFLGLRGEAAPPLSEDELRLVLQESHKGGVITASEARIIHQAFEFADKTAEQIMVPMRDIAYLSLSRTTADNVAVATRSQHTRLPLCRDGLDSIVGIINMKDAWPVLLTANSSDALESVSRPVTWLDAATPQDQVLRIFQEHKTHMGCVREVSTGRLLGIITLEEVLESLLGDLREGKIA